MGPAFYTFGELIADDPTIEDLKKGLVSVVEENKDLKNKIIKLEQQISNLNYLLERMEDRMDKDTSARVLAEAERARDVAENMAKDQLETIAGLMRDRKMWKYKIQELEEQLKRKTN